MRVGSACLSLALEYLNGERSWGRVEYGDGRLGKKNLRPAKPCVKMALATRGRPLALMRLPVGGLTDSVFV